MTLSLEMHLASAVAALLLGGGALVRGPRRPRNLWFAALAGAIALWNLGTVAELTGLAPSFPWPKVYLLGGLMSAPFGWQLSLVLADSPRRRRRRLLWITVPLTLAFWGTVFTPLYAWEPEWNYLALVLVGVMLAGALGVLFADLRRRTTEPERSVFGLVAAAAVVAVIGGVSDFIPRGEPSFPKIGQVAVFVFLLAVSALLARHRFLDVDVFFVRAAGLISAAAAVAAGTYLVVVLYGVRWFPLFLAALVMVIAGAALARVLLSGARGWFNAPDPLAHSLVQASRAMATARTRKDLWRIIDQSRSLLPPGTRLHIYFRSPEGECFRPIQGDGPAIEERMGLARWLMREREPLTQRALTEIALGEDPESPEHPATAALEDLRRLDAGLVVPLFQGDRLTGWLGLGGEPVSRFLTREIASALGAVGQQALADFERIDALERAARQETLAAVGQMAAGLAHEVRNPVAAIRGAADVVRGTDDAGQIQEMLHVIDQEARRLEQVVEEFLDYARPPSPKRQKVDLAELLRGVLREAELAGLGMRTVLDVAPDTPLVSVDPGQVQRALANLIRNAREAAGASGTLAISMAGIPGGGVRMRVEDDGPGIPLELFGDLFRPFVTGKARGTGLGLALVHRVMESHGGTIEAEPDRPHGAAFLLSFPGAEQT